MHFATTLLSLSFLAAQTYGQQAGTLTAETHPSLSWQKCTSGGSCTSQPGTVALDANWRWVHSTSSATNCYTGNTWDKTLCPDPLTCAKNCALDGADYSGTYGITTSGSALTLKFVTGSNVGSRVYLMASDTKYQLFKLKNQEFTFDVNVANLPCGLNGALYFSQMDADGGASKYPSNTAGAKYGTGYCDSQCPRDIKFINGQANSGNWTGAPNNGNTGTGQYGTCCTEMDIWEANNNAAAYTPHPCTVNGQTQCSGADCGATDRYSGVCDPDGCDFNSYRQGNTTFYGAGATVDTKSTFTIVTQFITADGTASGPLSEIRRLYVQNGKVIQNSFSTFPGTTAYNSISDAYCTAQKTAFGDSNSFAAHGGLSGMDEAFDAGVVLVMSVWDDYAANMLWLDSVYPVGGDATKPGIKRGTCATDSGVPKQIEGQSPGATVVYSNIKFGDIGSTYPNNGGGGGGGTTTTTRITSTSTTTTSSVSTTTTSVPGTVPHYGQCGGLTYSGPTTCASPYRCVYSNDWYSQCL